MNYRDSIWQRCRSAVRVWSEFLAAETRFKPTTKDREWLWLSLSSSLTFQTESKHDWLESLLATLSQKLFFTRMSFLELLPFCLCSTFHIVGHRLQIPSTKLPGLLRKVKSGDLWKQVQFKDFKSQTNMLDYHHGCKSIGDILATSDVSLTFIVTFTVAELLYLLGFGVI